MSSKASVNIEGDYKLYNSRKLREAALNISEKFWKCAVPAPDNFKVDVRIVNRDEIIRLNREIFGRTGPTDVIAFSLCEGEETPPETPCLLGQIIICSPVAEENSRLFGNSFKREMNLLFVHGMLHLCGWQEGEGIENAQAEIMEIFFSNQKDA